MLQLFYVNLDMWKERMKEKSFDRIVYSKIWEGRKPIPLPRRNQHYNYRVIRDPEVSPNANGVARELNTPYDTVRKILTKVIEFYPREICHHQQSPGRFYSKIFNKNRCGWYLPMEIFMERWSPLPFWMEQSIRYTQNCRIWATEPSNVFQERSLHSPTHDVVWLQGKFHSWTSYSFL